MSANLSKTLFDIIGPANKYPHKVRKAMFSKEPTNIQVFTMAMFMLGNGVSPEFMVDWVASRGTSASGNKNARTIAAQWDSGFFTGDGNHKYSYWDIQEQRSLYQNGDAVRFK